MVSSVSVCLLDMDNYLCCGFDLFCCDVGLVVECEFFQVCVEGFVVQVDVVVIVVGLGCVIDGGVLVGGFGVVVVGGVFVGQECYWCVVVVDVDVDFMGNVWFFVMVGEQVGQFVIGVDQVQCWVGGQGFVGYVDVQCCGVGFGVVGYVVLVFEGEFEGCFVYVVVIDFGQGDGWELYVWGDCYYCVGGIVFQGYVVVQVDGIWLVVVLVVLVVVYVCLVDGWCGQVWFFDGDVGCWLGVGIGL